MNLKLGGYLAFFAPARQEKIDIALGEPTRLRDVLGRLGIPIAEVYLTVINGEQVSLDEALVQDTDEVHLYSPVDGG